MALYRRVVAINTGLLIVAALVLAFSPATVSRHMTIEEWVVLALGTALAVIVNVLVLRRVFEPLQRLQAVMRRVDPHAPGRRVGIDDWHVEEVAGVARALNDMLDRLESERAASGRRALAAQEAERRRVARDLHDEVGQLLTSVVLQLEGASRTAPPRLRADLVEVQETAREGVEAVREIARGLRPPALDEFGLRAALVALAEGFGSARGFRSQLRSPGSCPAWTAMPSSRSTAWPRRRSPTPPGTPRRRPSRWRWRGPTARSGCASATTAPASPPTGSTTVAAASRGCANGRC
ncbi:MAG TPA: histidine kinase [Solirubrobacteraceae bacterium]|nr:histidine kinase [Solirubrobacteraceae bacterium]